MDQLSRPDKQGRDGDIIVYGIFNRHSSMVEITHFLDEPGIKIPFLISLSSESLICLGENIGSPTYFTLGKLEKMSKKRKNHARL